MFCGVVKDALIVRLGPEGVDPRVGLDRPGQVADVEEERLAVAALADDAPGDPAGVLRVLTLPQLGGVVRGDDVLDPVAIWK